MYRRVKLGLSLAGLLLAIAAIALNDTRLTWVAIGSLAASVGMRFWGRKPGNRDPGSGQDGEPPA